MAARAGQPAAAATRGERLTSTLQTCSPSAGSIPTTRTGSDASPTTVPATNPSCVCTPPYSAVASPGDTIGVGSSGGVTVVVITPGVARSRSAADSVRASATACHATTASTAATGNGHQRRRTARARRARPGAAGASGGAGSPVSSSCTSAMRPAPMRPP
ncbi:hypothetical protein [Cellulomonas sp. GbtcB1]|uniref:hypothetical protein n=1 Tax=Cellulomonas sp. GbtcB1 TaxID=2824746 RepID=UPI001C306C18|nr:hypothetical protein [Cellulomonas sp. GbtcB1]